ncbi:hypothetical protein BDR22DRAFT_893781 [Usnea florida]
MSWAQIQKMRNWNPMSQGGSDDALAFGGAQSTDQQSNPTSDQKDSENLRLTTRIERLQKELDDHGLDHGPQLEDQEAKNRVRDVLVSLREWSEKFGNRQPDSHGTVSEDVVRIIAPGVYSDNLDQGTVSAIGVSRQLFLRGWTAYNMCSLIFGQNQHDSDDGVITQDLWLKNSTSQSYSLIERLFKDTLPTERISARTFHNWRALTANLLAKTAAIEHNDTGRAQVEAKVEELLGSIRPLCPPDIAPARKELQKIFQEAIEVAKVLRQQRAVWILRFPTRDRSEEQQDSSFKFNSERMKDRVDHEGDRCVKIIYEPMLIKQGTLEGCDYDQEEVIHKAKVVTCPPKGVSKDEKGLVSGGETYPIKLE